MYHNHLNKQIKIATKYNFHCHYLAHIFEKSREHAMNERVPAQLPDSSLDLRVHSAISNLAILLVVLQT